MKPKIIPFSVAICLLLLTSCTDEILLDQDKPSKLKSSFATKPSVLKLSFVEQNIRRTDFPEGKAMELGLTFLEEPKSEKKRTYIEVYEDFTFSKEVVYMKSPYNYPADQHSLPEDMPEVKRFLYQNGVTKGYDDKSNLIFEEGGGEIYWMEPSNFSSNEEAWSFLYNSYANPKKNSAFLLSKITANQSYTELSENILEISSEVGGSSLNSTARNIDEDVVKTEKKYFLKDFGVMYRVDGYTQAGVLKDMEHNFYGFTEDSILYLKSSHYRNEEILAGYDISVLEISDTFYSDFKFESTL